MDLQNDRLLQANAALRIKDDLSVEKNRNLIFIYCPQKVGSTTLVTSLRVSAATKMTVIHLHNEAMMTTLYKVEGISILEIIRFNKSLGKNVFVIDVFRTPIEHKISLFFERIDTFHFNITPLSLVQIPIKTMINRFIKIYPHIENIDYFKTIYGIQVPPQFDTNIKYALVDDGGIKFIKLRLSDSKYWADILTKIIGIPIYLFTDYETANKPVKDAFQSFKKDLRIPSRILDRLMDNVELKYYMSAAEIADYMTLWRAKSVVDDSVAPFNAQQFQLYKEISLQNKHFSEFQTQHYADEGCLCPMCSAQRAVVLDLIKRGNKVPGKVIHNASGVQNRTPNGVQTRIQHVDSNTPIIAEPNSISARQTNPNMRRTMSVSTTNRMPIENSFQSQIGFHSSMTGSSAPISMASNLQHRNIRRRLQPNQQGQGTGIGTGIGIGTGTTPTNTAKPRLKIDTGAFPTHRPK